MMKNKMKRLVLENPILVIMRNVPTEKILDYAGAVMDGGIRFFEVALNSKDALEQIALLKKHYGDLVFETTISRNVKLSEAPGFGMPAYYHDRSAKGAKEYLQIARELIQRV